MALVLLGLLQYAQCKKAIVTLLSGDSANAERYTRLLHFFVYSLRNAGYDGEIVVMYARDFPVDVVKLSERLNVVMVGVEKLTVSITRRNEHYASMLTKLHLWNLIEYEQVMYYDCDFIFQRNPVGAFDQCSWSALCATLDTGISDVDKSIKPGTYFNGGFLVLKPSKTTYNYLLSKRNIANGKYFVEQDMLNELYRGRWGRLDQSYNLMHCYKLKNIEENVIAIHEKMWILRKSFPGSNYIWNSPKMQVNYPITDVLILGKTGGEVVHSISKRKSNTNINTNSAGSSIGNSGDNSMAVGRSKDANVRIVDAQTISDINSRNAINMAIASASNKINGFGSSSNVGNSGSNSAGNNMNGNSNGNALMPTSGAAGAAAVEFLAQQSKAQQESTAFNSNFQTSSGGMKSKESPATTAQRMYREAVKTRQQQQQQLHKRRFRPVRADPVPSPSGPSGHSGDNINTNSNSNIMDSTRMDSNNIMDGGISSVNAGSNSISNPGQITAPGLRSRQRQRSAGLDIAVAYKNKHTVRYNHDEVANLVNTALTKSKIYDNSLGNSIGNDNEGVVSTLTQEADVNNNVNRNINNKNNNVNWNNDQVAQPLYSVAVVNSPSLNLNSEGQYVRSRTNMKMNTKKKPRNYPAEREDAQQQ